jgi:hypothetical protein
MPRWKNGEEMRDYYWRHRTRLAGMGMLLERWNEDIKAHPEAQANPLILANRYDVRQAKMTTVSLLRASLWCFHVMISSDRHGGHPLPVLIQVQSHDPTHAPHLEFMGLRWTRAELTLVEDLTHNLWILACSASTVPRTSFIPIFNNAMAVTDLSWRCAFIFFPCNL